MGRIKNIPPNMASSSQATTCLVHPMSYKATLKLSPQKKDLVENVKYRCFFIKKIFAAHPHHYQVVCSNVYLILVPLYQESQ